MNPRPHIRAGAPALRTAFAIVLVCAGAVGLGALVIWRSIFAGAFGLGLVLLIASTIRRPPPGPKTYRWVPIAWVVLFAASNWKITSGRTPLNAVSGSLSVENKIELAAYAAVATMVLFHLYLMRRSPRPLGIGPLIAWPLFAVLSASWSTIPPFSLIRSLQLLVPIALAVLHVRIWRADRRLGEILWRRTLRLIVQLITLAVAAGFVFHSWPEGRFNWPGSPHPIVASGIAGFGFVLLVAGGRSLMGFSWPSYVVRIGLFAGALLFGQTRSALLGVGLACLVALWLRGRDRPLARYLVIPTYLGSLFFVVALAQSTVVGYVQRGRYGGLSTLNGRLPLWQLALQDVAARGRILIGSGFGSTRVILSAQVSYAGEAHNSWVQFLLELGLAGTILAVVGVAFLGYRLLRRRGRTGAACRGAAALFVYLLVLSQADNYLANVGFAYTTIALLYTWALSAYVEEGARRLSRVTGDTERTLTARGRHPVEVLG